MSLFIENRGRTHPPLIPPLLKIEGESSVNIRESSPSLGKGRDGGWVICSKILT